MKHLINLFLFLVPFVAITAQKQLDRGYVKMEITDVTSDDPQMAMSLEMMKGSITEIYFTKEKYKTSMNMMGGMIQMVNHVDIASKKMDMLFSAMGNKMWVDTNTDEAEGSTPGSQNMEDFNVEYDREQTKDILGYKTFKATINMPNAEGTRVEGWVTKEIKTDANIIQGMSNLKLEGFPLEFSIVSPQMKLTFTATDIKDTVEDNEFVLNTDGYKKMTMKEFSESMGGMGAGFGF